MWLTKLFIGDQEIILCIDETGDKKKGKSTDYTARQYIGNIGKTENGIVSVNASVGVGAFVVTQGQRVLCQAADERSSLAK